jgi:DNA-binding transcriptional ArsR family regulator
MSPIAEHQTIADVETIKVFADERRLAILAALRQPMTVKELADRLQTPQSQLYYHVNLLEKHSLIQVVATQVISGIIEKQYQVTARQFRIRNPMLMGDMITPDETFAVFASLLDETKAELQRAFQAMPPLVAGTPPLHPFVSKKALRLTHEQLLAFHGQLSALISACDQLTATADNSAAEFGLSLAFYELLQSDE